ncbi:hypothetical protein K458DRAFT_422202 [Lentithecium fluviatile CBS 122367]|uniref:Uncharacterized protein n=1 Tax=Lentithecium fluviatile CBS 122367 TaxID=1168545 RepID=A0A6G1IN68_9PLEO|nr:hypothetical protein K458DRAFT_422202 [Lentithecium fluviatile CBS 122367]
MVEILGLRLPFPVTPASALLSRLPTPKGTPWLSSNQPRQTDCTRSETRNALFPSPDP